MKKFILGTITGAAIASTVAIAATYTAAPATFKVLVNGKEFTSDPPAMVINDRTYLPLRAIGDALGVPVDWNDELKQAEVGNAEIAKSGYSRLNPVPIGTAQEYTYSSEIFPQDGYTTSAKIIEIVRDEQAYEDLLNLSKYYPEPDDGYEYINAKIAFSVIDTKSDFSIFATGSSFHSYTSNNEECPQNYHTSIEPSLSGNLYSGGKAEGWATFMVKKDDPNPKLAYGLDIDGAGGIWFALYE